jgi:cell division protein FtsI/penicillin-binding protein 2
VIHKFHRRRIMFCFALVAGAYLVLVGRLVQVQVLQPDVIRKFIGSPHLRRLPIRASRGRIYSSSGIVLAQSVPVHSLFADPSQFEQPPASVRVPEVARTLAGILDLDAAEISRKLASGWRPKAAGGPFGPASGWRPKAAGGPFGPASGPRASSRPAALPREPGARAAPERDGATAPGTVAAGPGLPPVPGQRQDAAPSLAAPSSLLPAALGDLVPGVLSGPPSPSPPPPPRKGRRFVWIKRKLEPREHELVASLIASQKIKGLGFRKEYRRVYPNSSLMAQVLGFTGTDEEGLEGLEHKYDHVLGGKPGERMVVVGANGMVLHEVVRRKPEGYHDLHLTVDHVIQHYVERELDKAYALHNPKHCFAAAMDPMTGEILAMAARPTFDPNAYRESDREFWRNRIVSDTFEPGSTFKLVTASAALEDKRVVPTDSFHCPGQIVLWDMPIHCTGVHGEVTLEQVIEKSCNFGAIKVGMLQGPKNLYYYIRKFGFGERTGIDLPSEVDGLVRPPEQWSGVSIGAVSIGQEIAVSGIQMLAAVSAIANGGRLVKPQIIKKITDVETGAVLSESQLDARHRVISPATAEHVARMMTMVTRSGSGTLGALDDYPVAGKTGTSEKLGRAKEEGLMRYVASFVGFVPVHDPKVVIYVVLNEPKGERVSGGAMAAPVFREIARQIMLVKKVAPEMGAGAPTVPLPAPAGGRGVRVTEDEEEAAAPPPPSGSGAPGSEEDDEAPSDGTDDAGVDREADGD